MTSQIKFARSFSSWLPLVLLTTFLALSTFLQDQFPLLFCSPMNSGGKELVCGNAYSSLPVRLIYILFQFSYLACLVVSALQVCNRRITKLGFWVFVLNICILILAVVLALYFGNEDSP